MLSFAIPLIAGIAPDDYRSTVRRYFDTGVEGNLPTWWATAVLVAAAVLSAAAGASCRLAGRSGAAAWLILGLIPFTFSLDEATILHEHLDQAVEFLFGSQEVAYPWLILGTPLAIAVVITVSWCAPQLPKLTGKVMLLGYGVFFLGAVGLELISGVLVAWEMKLLFMTLYNIEELLEMIGASLMVTAPLTAFRYSARSGHLQIRTAAKAGVVRETVPNLTAGVRR